MKNIKLWGWVLHAKDTSCKATYEIKYLKIIECIYKIAFQCIKWNHVV